MSAPAMDVFEEIEVANRAYADAGRHRRLDVRPTRHLAVVTCMDARIDTFEALGLALGDAHILRTAGARVTDDVLRSLTLSTHVLGTRAVAVIGHTRCGLYDPEGTTEQRLRDLMGHPPYGTGWGTFSDVTQAVADDCARVLMWPDRPEGLTVAGYLFDVDEGRLARVVEPAAAEAPPRW